jgi:hypothetical protein
MLTEPKNKFRMKNMMMEMPNNIISIVVLLLLISPKDDSNSARSRGEYLDEKQE